MEEEEEEGAWDRVLLRTREKADINPLVLDEPNSLDFRNNQRSFLLVKYFIPSSFTGSLRGIIYLRFPI